MMAESSQADSSQAESKKRCANYVKAIWEEKAGGKYEVGSVPRCWVAKHRNLLYWPKNATAETVRSGLPRPPPGTKDGKKWYKFKLISVSDTFRSLEEAEGADSTDVEKREVEDTDSEHDHVDIEDPLSPEQKGPGKRKRKSSSFGNDFVPGSEIDKQLVTDKGTGKKSVPIPVRVISQRLGDVSGSNKVMEELKTGSKLVPTKASLKQLGRSGVALTQGNIMNLQDRDEDTVSHVSESDDDEMDTALSLQSQTQSLKSNASSRKSELADNVSMKMQLANMAADIKIQMNEIRGLKSDVQKLRKDVLAFSSSQSTPNTSQDTVQLEEDSDEEDLLKHFPGVDSFPMHTFNEFDFVERELKNHHSKRKFLRSFFKSKAKSMDDILKNVFSQVVARPALCENFNCGGPSKAGSVLTEPVEKRDFTSTQVNRCLKLVVQELEPTLTDVQYKSKLSAYLKRASSLKGGKAYLQKNPLSTLPGPSSPPESTQPAPSSPPASSHPSSPTAPIPPIPQLGDDNGDVGEQ